MARTSWIAKRLTAMGFSLCLVAAGGQPPRPGDVQRLDVVSVSLQVGSTEKESRQVTYTPPPGWYVCGHSVRCTAKRGNSSYSVATVPRNWSWLSEEQVKESYKVLIDLAGKCHSGPAVEPSELQAKFALERDALLRGLRRVRATHHALVVEATARGEGFLRGGGCVELTVTAELIYVGTKESLEEATSRRRAALEQAPRRRPRP
jgi:hypothetical protein